MSLDQNALDSLRIERSPEPPSDSGKPYKWFLAIVLVVAVAAAAWALLRDPAIEVETATAVATSSATGGGYTRTGHTSEERPRRQDRECS
jgi:hypothetical protein